jgi:hypothetical protein
LHRGNESITIVSWDIYFTACAEQWILKLSDMKELRSFGGHLRALCCFDPERNAIVLVGGDKRDDRSGWYERNVPLADDLFDEHLRLQGLD